MVAGSTQITKFVMNFWVSRFYFEKSYLARKGVNLLVYLASKAKVISRQ